MQTRGMHTRARTFLAALAVVQVACGNEPTPPVPEPPSLSAEAEALIRIVRPQGVSRIPPLAPPPVVRPDLVSLGRALAFDRILSGTRTISCMTCHHPAFATVDGRSLSVGQAGSGLGSQRTPTVANDRAFIPRNSPALFNLAGQRSFFHDGRVEQAFSVPPGGVPPGGVPQNGFRTPAGAQLTADMTRVLEFGAASAVGLFPVTDRDEMRGTSGNELASLADTDFTGIWSALMRRLGDIPEYRTMFEAAYPGTAFGQMSFAHASNAIAGFLIAEFSFRRSPWDNFLAGDDRAVTTPQLRGARTFLAQTCSICHGGPTLTNVAFFNTGLVQVGPGKGNGPGGRDDFGRQNVTGIPFDLYRFRTPTLRNVELTAPYGHAGQIVSLREFIKHYDDPATALATYDINQLEPALRGTRVANDAQLLSGLDGLVRGINLTDQDLDDLTEFLKALTDPAARNLSSRVPQRVPSGLPVDRP